MFLYLVLMMVVVGAIAVVAVVCKKLCHPENTSGSPVSTEMNHNADGMTHQIHEDPPTAPVNNVGVSKDDGTGGAVKEEGVISKGEAIRCACSAHGSGGCVTVAEVS